MDLPVVDLTDVKGFYDFTLSYTRDLPLGFSEGGKINGEDPDTSGTGGNRAWVHSSCLTGSSTDLGDFNHSRKHHKPTPQGTTSQRSNPTHASGSPCMGIESHFRIILRLENAVTPRPWTHFWGLLPSNRLLGRRRR